MKFNYSKLVYLLGFISLSVLAMMQVWSSSSLLVSAKEKSDILFLKGKFILKDKKGSIVISDEKKACHCPMHYYR